MYEPPTDGTPAPLVLFHGGGWMLGDLDTRDALYRELVNENGCLVASVDYRIAPEHRFPTGLENCYAATERVAANADALGCQIDALAVAGDSAGGTLTAGVGLLTCNRDGPEINYQVLAYPATNHAFETDSYEENNQAYFFAARI